MNENRYATFWRRFGASGVDGAILAPIHLLFALASYAALSSLSDWRWLAASQVAAGVSLVYAIILHARWGQTVGKMATGVRVVAAKGEGRISPLQACLRETPNIVIFVVSFGLLWNFLSKDLSEIVWRTPDNQVHFDREAVIAVGLATSISFAWTGLEALTMLTNRRRRALHDFIAGTVVVRTEFAEQRWPRTYPDKVELTAGQIEALRAADPYGHGSLAPGMVTHPMYRVGWPRVWAAVVDGIVSMVIWGMLAASLAGAGLGRTAIGFTAMLGYAAYDTFGHANGGQTLGKVALNITVVDAATLRTPTPKQAAIRAVGLWWAAIAFLATSGLVHAATNANPAQAGLNEWLLPAFICMLVTPQRRALHDLIAGTTVIKKDFVVRPTWPAGERGSPEFKPSGAGW